MKKNFNFNYLPCDCGDLAHLIRWEIDDGFLIFETVLNPRYRFFARIRAALYYIFSIDYFNTYECVMIDRDRAMKWLDQVKTELLKGTNGNTN